MGTPYLRDVPELQNIMSASGTVASKLLQGLNWLTWALTGSLVVSFVGIYVAIDPELYATGLTKLAPASGNRASKRPCSDCALTWENGSPVV